MKKYLPFLIAILAFFCFAPKTHAAYTYYRTITVTSTATVASGTNSNFPMLVSSTLTSWESSSTGAGARIQNLVTAPNGSQEPADLIFVTSTPTASGANWNCGTSLNFETERYVSSTGELVDWVNVPSVSTGTVIYACYGDATVTTDQSHPSSTWNSNYVSVFHFPNGTVLNASDSTSNVLNMTNSGVTATSSSVIDGGASGSGASMTHASNTAYDSSDFTIETWFNAMNFGSGYEGLINNWDTTPGVQGHYMMYLLNTDSKLHIDIPFVVADPVGPTGVISTSTWYDAAITKSGNNYAIYLNGQSTSTNTNASAPGSGQPMNLWLGASGQTLNGKMDETRISNAARSASWILTEYNNQNSPSTFYAVGSETAGSVASTPIAPHFSILSPMVIQGAVVIN